MKITPVNDSATISGTEYGLASDSTSIVAQTEDCQLQAFIDFSNMAAGDQYQVRVLEKVNGGTARDVFPPSILEGAQPSLWVSPLLLVVDGWEVTVKKLAGTDRSIAWSLRKMTEGETVVIADGGITAAKIADGTLTAAKLGDGAITSAKFASGAINAAAVADGAIDAGAVADGAITSAKFATGAITAAAVADGAIDAGAIADGAITAAKIATDAIDADAIAASAVTEIQAGLGTAANQGAILGAVSAILALAGEIQIDTDAIEADTQDIQGRLPAALVSGRMDSSVGAMAANVLTAAALAADAATEIATAVWSTVLSGSRTAKGMLRRTHAALVFKTAGMNGPTGTVYDEDGTTKLVEADLDPNSGTRDTPSTIAGD